MTVLDLDSILGKTIRVLKSMKVVSKEDAKAVERQGIAPPNDSNLVKGYDVKGLNSSTLNLNATTVGSSVAATISTT